MNEYRDIVKTIYNKQYLLLKCFAVWKLSPDTSNTIKTLYKIYFWYFLIFWNLLFHWCMIMQVVTHHDNVEEIIKVLFVFATTIASFGKYLFTKSKNQHFENLFKLMFEEKFLPQNKAERKLFLESVKLGTQVRTIYTYLSLTALSGLMITQVLSSSKDFPVDIYVPFDLESNWKYNLVYFWESVSMGVVCLTNVGFDSLSSSLFIYLKGQLEMLGYRLENIGRNLRNSSDDIILLQLKDCIRYYNRILKMSHNIEYLLSLPISLQIACSVFVLISNFYAMSLVSRNSNK